MLEGYRDILSIAEAREILHVGRNSIYELLNEGKIPAFKIGKNWKIPKAGLIQYINQWRTVDNGGLQPGMIFDKK